MVQVRVSGYLILGFEMISKVSDHHILLLVVDFPQKSNHLTQVFDFSALFQSSIHFLLSTHASSLHSYSLFIPSRQSSICTA